MLKNTLQKTLDSVKKQTLSDWAVNSHQRRFYDEAVAKRLDGYFVYEYSLCRNLIPANKFHLKIVFDRLTKPPDTYVKYLKLKYRILPEPKE